MNNIIQVDPAAMQMYKDLLSFSKSIQNTNQQINDIHEKIKSEQNKRREIIGQQLNNLEACMKKVHAIISISKQRISGIELSLPNSSEPYNPDNLNRILIRMNSNQTDNTIAKELFFHAKAQEMDLNKKIEDIKANSSECELELLNQIKISEHEKALSFKKLEQSALSYLEAYKTHKSNHIQEYIGNACLRINLEEKYDKELMNIFGYSIQKEGFHIDLWSNLNHSACCCIENDTKTHNNIIDFIRMIIVSSAQQYKERLSKVLYIDPYLMNDSEICDLTEPTQGKKCIISVPQSKHQITEYIRNLKESLKHDAASQKNDFYICVFNGYPEEYDSESQDIIREICFNADRFHTLVILTNNVDSEKSRGIPHQAFPAQYYRCNKGQIETHTDDELLITNIHFSVNTFFETDNIALLHREAKKTNLVNRYDERLTPESIIRKNKGTKKATDLPYAISDQGELLKTNLAFGFLYGINGSGKSTLLHTLITSIIATMHPDDVELWLVDFKMVEFNRYIRFCPPHIRKVILDSSPEMVFDLLDRLSSILEKRKIRFDENQWSSIQDANRDEVYMPLYIVIIDEFPVMSHIIADHFEYKEKLIQLLTKGRQFGFIIIMSGQYYSFGLQGLPQAAKDQLRWRVAMYGTNDEIKATLDLHNKTERDYALINRLQNHYTLVKRPPDYEGNELDYGKVLFFGTDTEGEKNQLSWIKKSTSNLQPSSEYNQTDQSTYFNKHPDFYDGHSYTSFLSVVSAIRDELEAKYALSESTNTIALYPGQPRCLKSLYAIVIRNYRNENILICGQPQQTEEFLSLPLSLVKSCYLNPDCSMTIIASTARSLTKRMCELLTAQTKARTFQNEHDIVNEIRRIYNCVINKKDGKEFLMLIDYPQIRDIINDIDNQGMNSHKQKALFDSDNIQNPEDIFGGSQEKPGLLSRIKNKAPIEPIQDITNTSKQDSHQYEAPSITTMLDTILHTGSRYGYHVIMLFLSPQDAMTYRKDTDYCIHKFFYKASRDDVWLLTRSKETHYIEEMEPYTYRYIGAINAMSYRPYLHEGIELEGWYLNGTIIERSKTKTGSYLE